MSNKAEFNFHVHWEEYLLAEMEGCVLRSMNSFRHFPLHFSWFKGSSCLFSLLSFFPIHFLPFSIFLKVNLPDSLLVHTEIQNLKERVAHFFFFFFLSLETTWPYRLQNGMPRDFTSQVNWYLQSFLLL